VLFKDPRLYAYDDNAYALWDGVSNRPWGNFRRYRDEETGEERVVQIEHWVDAYAPFVHEYNIAVAQELEELGVDEIQFDYVRFPSDGRTERIQSRFREPGMTRVSALESFLASAREALDIPISVDVFGFNAWARMSYLGQDVGAMSRYVDAISPMWYPSHFSDRFLPDMPFFERSRFIYSEGTYRLRKLTEDRTLIRPYVQAFLIGEELSLERTEYGRYLEEQMAGSLEAAASGLAFWNASGRYYMFTRPLTPYTERDKSTGRLAAEARATGGLFYTANSR
jgi:hypothetical protein